MKLFAFDTCQHNSLERQAGWCHGDACTEYSKRWGTLLSPGFDIEVAVGASYASKWVEIQGGTEWLLLIHQSCEWCHPENPVGFIMYVSGGAEGASKPKGNNDPAYPQIHYSRRIVPTGADLGYLKESFSKLFSSLCNAGADIKKINLAWDEWESPVLVRLISLMAPLVLVPKDEMLFNIVAKRIRMDFDDTHLRLAAWELGNSAGEIALQNWMIEQTWFGGHELYEWMKKYPQTFRDLARRYL